MAKLGEAYVRIRADLEPFGKDLDRGLKIITDKFERALNRNIGRALGRDMGGGVREGLKESTYGIGKELDGTLRIPANRQRGRRAGQEFGDGYGDGLLGTIRRISGLFITALEDGFSSLPPQIKGVVGAALIAGIVPSGAFLSAAIGTAVIAGVAGVGIALASQFQEVEDSWSRFAERLRDRGVEAARPFAGETVAALDLFDRKLDEIDPKVESLFSNAAKYVEPFSRGIADLVDNLVTGLDEGLKEAEFNSLASTLETGLGGIGESLGEAFEVLLSNPDLDIALSDLLETTGDLIEVGGALLDWTTSAWADFRRLAAPVGDFVGLLGDLVGVISGLTQGADADGFAELEESWDDLVFRVTGGGDEIIMKQREITNSEREWNNQTSATIKLTKEQEKALADLNRQIEAQYRLINDVISTQIDYQESIDRTTEGLKENGRTLDLRGAKGRENAKNIQTEINNLKEQVKAQLESGQLTEEQAQTFYNNEIARIRNRFKGNKELLGQFDALFAKLIELQTVPPVPNKLGPFAAALAPIIKALREIQARTAELRQSALPSSKNTTGVGPGQQKYADGGFITEPTNAIMGENYREEVVLPLTNTRRSMQLLGQSPLAGLLGGGTNVAVYIGNEQLEGRMVKVATSVNRQSAKIMNQVPRSV